MIESNWFRIRILHNQWLIALRSRCDRRLSLPARATDHKDEGERSEAALKTAYLFDTVYAASEGDGTFAVRALPPSVQFAPVRAILAEDIDVDGHKDLILAGNFDAVPPRRGRYDASYGWYLRGDGRGTFAVVEPAESNLWLTGQVRALRQVRGADGTSLIVAARNDAPLQIVRRNEAP